MAQSNKHKYISLTWLFLWNKSVNIFIGMCLTQYEHLKISKASMQSA